MLCHVFWRTYSAFSTNAFTHSACSFPLTPVSEWDGCTGIYFPAHIPSVQFVILNEWLLTMPTPNAQTVTWSVKLLDEQRECRFLKSKNIRNKNNNWDGEGHIKGTLMYYLGLHVMGERAPLAFFPFSCQFVKETPWYNKKNSMSPVKHPWLGVCWGMMTPRSPHCT